MKIQITDLKLPEKKVENILSILESNNMPVRLPTDCSSFNVNCWGFTAYYYEWEQKAFWMEGHQMEAHLKNHTKPISKDKVRAGDIAIFRDKDNHLEHTAVMVDNGNVICHKPGGTPLCINTIESASISYGSVTYARVTKKVEKEFDKSRGLC